MIRIENFIQLKAFARQDAFVLSIIWIASFACITVVPAGVLGNLLALATPFILRLLVVRTRAVCLFPLSRPRSLRHHDYREHAFARPYV